MINPQDNSAALFKAYLLDNLGQEKYDLWFSQIDVSVEDDNLCLSATNAFVEKMIRRSYLPLLEEAGNTIFGSPLAISFKIAKSSTSASQSKPTKPPVAQRPAKFHVTAPVVVEDSPKHETRYRLDDFIVGEKNKIAVRAARACIESSESLFNPLFFFGSYGLGKTHLLKAIVNESREKNPTLKCKYISAEDFTNQYVNATLRKDMNGFRNRFRNVDVLAIDDIHFIANKKGTQEEFLNTFNSIDMANKKIILASDSHPAMIEELTESLVSRFVSGMVVKMEMPEFETRKKIAISKAKSLGFELKTDIADYVAENITTSVRELEGAIKKLSAQYLLLNQPLTVSSAQYLLADTISRTCTRVDLDDIIHSSATYFNISLKEIRSKDRTKTVSLARAVAMYIIRENTEMSFPEIGNAFGGKNHATVILACKKINEMLQNDASVDWKQKGFRRAEKLSSIIKQLSDSLGL